MIHDVAVVGAGPAGLSASIALACEGKLVALLDKDDSVGGQIAHSHLVENVVGYASGFCGSDFGESAYKQAVGLGVDIMLGQQVMVVSRGFDGFSLATPSTIVHSKAVLITVGVAPKPVPFESDACCNVTNELHLQPAREGEAILVYGGGNSAGQAACYYSKRGCYVTIVSRRPLEETMDVRWIASLQGLGVIRVTGEIQEVANDSVLFCESGDVQRLEAPTTLHSFLGGSPVTSWLAGVVDTDEQGYIVTNQQHMTSVPGIFAAGDCEYESVKRFSCAIGGGVEATAAIHRYLVSL